MPRECPHTTTGAPPLFSFSHLKAKYASFTTPSSVGTPVESAKPGKQTRLWVSSSFAQSSWWCILRDRFWNISLCLCYFQWFYLLSLSIKLFVSSEQKFLSMVSSKELCYVFLYFRDACHRVPLGNCTWYVPGLIKSHKKWSYCWLQRHTLFREHLFVD